MNFAVWWRGPIIYRPLDFIAYWEWEMEEVITQNTKIMTNPEITTLYSPNPVEIGGAIPLLLLASNLLVYLFQELFLHLLSMPWVCDNPAERERDLVKVCLLVIVWTSNECSLQICKDFYIWREYFIEEHFPENTKTLQSFELISFVLGPINGCSLPKMFCPFDSPVRRALAQLSIIRH